MATRRTGQWIFRHGCKLRTWLAMNRLKHLPALGQSILNSPVPKRRVCWKPKESRSAIRQMCRCCRALVFGFIPARFLRWKAVTALARARLQEFSLVSYPCGTVDWLLVDQI